MRDITGLSSLGSAIPIQRDVPSVPAPGFKDILKEKTGPQASDQRDLGLRFSNHAVERMRSRGISLTENDLGRIEQAVDKAQVKGSRETLILMGDSAFIVNIKNKTVVTAMDRQMMKENVFTNIDSTVVI